MAVTSPWRARDALRLLVGEQTVPAGQILHDPYLPPGLFAAGGQPLRMDESEPIGGYGAEGRYLFPPELAGLVAGPPAEAGRASAEGRAAYGQTSLDLTMQGGTTSGVVYPLAICELATRFRFRNVGGASAGAIAAAFTAAAELGRSESMRGHVFAPPAGAPNAPPTAPGQPSGGPTLRRGFTGIADVMTWLTQAGPTDTAAPDEFRLAQLFRPGRRTARVFRVAVAVMRRRTWPLALLALMAFGPVTRVVATALLLGTVLATGWTGARFQRAADPWYVTVGWGAVEALAFLGTIVSLVLVIQSVLTIGARRRQAAASRASGSTALGSLRGVTSGGPTPKPPWVPGLVVGLVLLGGVVTVAVLTPWRYLGALAVGLAGAFVVVVVLVRSALALVGGFRSFSYGLIGGTEPMRRLGLLDRLAKTPKPTVAPSLVPWLSESLSQLAGLPAGEVLRFGHLWDGVSYVAAPGRAQPADLQRWRDQAADKDLRLVNLELMTTDLSRRRPYRFPLRVEDMETEPLFLQLDELEAAQVFPAPVIAALRDGPSVSASVDGEVRVFHRLPDPWDLPVIFAVRLSMALPILFQAVRMYRIRWDTALKDDFGRDVVRDGLPLTALTVDQPPAGANPPPLGLVAEELWFSDGGITSNFPVHFFDAALPRWPTVSLNLGMHPSTVPMQDVWLPQDWDPVPTPVEPLDTSALALLGAVLGTAMSWRDAMQSALPGYRNRIAQVRGRADEGGTNLFMTRDTIASMALRGALAGARLRTRFGNVDEWNRFRWVRLRTAVSNVERLRADAGDRQPYYDDALAGPAWLGQVQVDFLRGTPAPAGLGWFDPDISFWPNAGQLLRSFAAAHQPGAGPNPLVDRAPEPEPALRQVPRE